MPLHRKSSQNNQVYQKPCGLPRSGHLQQKSQACRRFVTRVSQFDLPRLLSSSTSSSLFAAKALKVVDQTERVPLSRPGDILRTRIEHGKEGYATCMCDPRGRQVSTRCLSTRKAGTTVVSESLATYVVLPGTGVNTFLKTPNALLQSRGRSTNHVTGRAPAGLSQKGFSDTNRCGSNSEDKQPCTRRSAESSPRGLDGD